MWSNKYLVESGTIDEYSNESKIIESNNCNVYGIDKENSIQCADIDNNCALELQN